MFFSKALFVFSVLATTLAAPILQSRDVPIENCTTFASGTLTTGQYLGASIFMTVLTLLFPRSEWPELLPRFQQ